MYATDCSIETLYAVTIKFLNWTFPFSIQLGLHIDDIYIGISFGTLTQRKVHYFSDIQAPPMWHVWHTDTFEIHIDIEHILNICSIIHFFNFRSVCRLIGTYLGSP